MNQHSSYIDKRINDLRKQGRFQSYVIDTPHSIFIRDYAHCLFTNLIRDVFTKTYLSKHKCADCGGKATDRCHGVNEDRPTLIRKALERAWPDTSQKIQMIDIVVAFLEEHKNTSFTFKCNPCHKNESKRI